ncbi:MAG: DUF2079 domain-containing protein [Candidatus Levybacteria bacterium]|nr:DUF2079 domain-containing protein [Candidatus Levybacteria bacterium]
MRNTFFSLLKFFIGWPISLVAIFFIVKIFLPQYQTLLVNLKNPNLLLLFLGIICFNVFYYLRSFIWKMLLEEKGHNIPLKEVVFLWGMAELKRFVPGNIWSFLGKGIAFSEKGVDKKTVTKLLLIEAEFFVIGCLIVSLLSFTFIFENNLNLVLLASISIILISSFFIFNKIVINKPVSPFLSVFKNLLPDYQPAINLKVLFISIMSLILFGFGTFFAISSITYLDTLIIFPLTGFFVLSLFAGYISFITPMGLGVREGILILGLSKIMSLQAAGFAAVYSRIILILSEMIFLITALIWKNLKNKLFLKIEKILANNPHKTFLIILIAVYIAYFTIASFLRHDNFYTGRFDLGNMDQTVWNTKNGNIFQLTDPNGTNIISRLSVHADFILILFAPFYFIWEDPKMLLFIQSAVLGFGAYFIYLLSLKVLKNKNISLVFSFVYLLSPFVQYANLYDFHAVALTTTLLLGSFYFLKVKKYLLFVLFLALAASTKEQIWVIAAIFGAYVFLIKKRKLLGTVIFIISSFLFYYLIWQAIPQARGGDHFALAYYSEFGESPISIIKNLIFSPLKTASIILEPKKIEYFKMLFWPTGFLAILSPAALIFALPDLLINTLSSNKQLSDIYYQYASAIIPFIFISSIYGVTILKKMLPSLKNSYVILILLFTSISAAYLYGPLPGAKNSNLDMFTKPYKNKDEIISFFSSIPEDSSIAATNNLGAHLSHREKIFVIPNGIEQANYIFFLLNDSYALPSLKFQIQLANDLKNDKNFRLIYEKDEFVAFKKLE